MRYTRIAAAHKAISVCMPAQIPQSSTSWQPNIAEALKVGRTTDSSDGNPDATSSRNHNNVQQTQAVSEYRSAIQGRTAPTTRKLSSGNQCYLGATRHVSDAKQPNTCCCLSRTTSSEALLAAACLYSVFKLIPSL